MVCRRWGALLTLSVFAFLEEKMSQLCCSLPKSGLPEAGSALQQKKSFQTCKTSYLLTWAVLKIFFRSTSFVVQLHKNQAFCCFSSKNNTSKQQNRTTRLSTTELWFVQKLKVSFEKKKFQKRVLGFLKTSLCRLKSFYYALP